MTKGGNDRAPSAADLANAIHPSIAQKLPATDENYYHWTVSGKEIVLAKSSKGYVVTLVHPLQSVLVASDDDLHKAKALVGPSSQNQGEQTASQATDSHQSTKSSNLKEPSSASNPSTASNPQGSSGPSGPSKGPSNEARTLAFEQSGNVGRAPPEDMPKFDDDYEMLAHPQFNGPQIPGAANPVRGGPLGDIGSRDLYPAGRNPLGNPMGNDINPLREGGMHPAPFGSGNTRPDIRYDPVAPGQGPPWDPMGGPPAPGAPGPPGPPGPGGFGGNSFI